MIEVICQGPEINEQQRQDIYKISEILPDRDFMILVIFTEEGHVASFFHKETDNLKKHHRKPISTCLEMTEKLLEIPFFRWMKGCQACMEVAI